MFQGIEDGGEWSEALLYSVVPLFPKAGQSAAEGADRQRPITLMSIWYRAWSSARYRYLWPWVKEWIAEELRGGIPAGEAHDSSIRVALEVERSLLSGVPLCGAELDESECFDSIIRELIWGSAEAIGAPPGLIKA